MFFSNLSMKDYSSDYLCDYCSQSNEITGILFYDGKICRVFITVKAELKLESGFENSVNAHWIPEIIDFIQTTGISKESLYFIINEH